jgi:putative drug exporter of the RND superfamily
MRALARFSYRRRRLVLAGWIALLAGLFALSSAFAGEFKLVFRLPGSESQAAVDLLEEKGANERTGDVGQVVLRADQGVNDPQVRQTAENFFNDIESNVEGVQVQSPYDPANSYEIAPGGRTAYAEVNFSFRTDEEYVEDAQVIKDLHDELQENLPSSLQVELGGDLFADDPEFSNEVFGILAAVVILLLVFGSVFAMGLPIVTALFGIGCAAALIRLTTNFLSVPEPTTQVAAMIGIGVGIDYALLIVTRYRTGLHNGLEPSQAVLMAMDTSGRAVVVAGLTVGISLLGMFFLNLDFIRSLAIGALLAVLMTMLAAITLLPAMLGFVGGKIDSLGVPFLHKRAETASAEGNRKSFWYRWSRLIQSKPWPALVVSSAVLIILAIPVFSIRLSFADAGNRPESDTTRRAYDVLSEGFGVGFNSPLMVVSETPNGGAASNNALTELTTALENTEGVATVGGPIPVAGGQLQVFNVVPNSAPQDEETAELVRRLRGQTIPPIAASGNIPTLVAG